MSKKKQKNLTLEDLVHFIIYRELDKVGVQNPYLKATNICAELRKAVEYRTTLSNNKS